jgi:RHS repeat-associated protein
MRKVLNRSRRILSMLLATSFVMTNTGFQTMADSIKPKEPVIVKNTKCNKNETNQNYEKIIKKLANGTYEGEKIGGTMYSNKYAGEDGSTIEAYYDEPIRYKDQNGKLKEYNSKLISTSSKKAVAYSGEVNSEIYGKKTYLFENQLGDSKQFFPKELNSNSPILMEKENYSISFAPEEISKNNAELKDGTVEYRIERKNITYNYESLNNGVKESIIFDKVPEENKYSFSYTLDGMYMKIEKKLNAVGLYDKKTKKQVGVLQTPYLLDSTKSNYSYNIATKVSNNKNEWTVTYTLPEEYLKNDKVTYPVTLDPTVTWITGYDSSEPVGISYVIELPEAGEYEQYINAVNRFTIGRSGVGDYYKTYMKFKNLGETLKDKVVNYASMNVNVAQQVGGEMNVDMHKVKSDWELDSLVWATEPDVEEDILSQSTIGIEDKTYNIDFTKYCNMVANGKADASKGIELRTEQKSKYMEFWGIRKQDKAPLFIISYSSRPESLNATYDGSFSASGEFDEETNTIKMTWDDYLDISGGPGRSYMVCKRIKDSFEPIGYTDETSFDVPVDDVDDIADIRIVARDNKGTNATEEDDTNVLSNILTFKKIENKSEDDNKDENVAVSYEQTTLDTDGDGLEDGYEIWDFKTLWNKEIGIDNNGNKIYDLDTDNDGFPDSYEVFTLGTDPTIANAKDANSDGDNWNDLKEYKEGTDPWLRDSDFDGTNDSGDATPRKTNDYTRQTRAAEAVVHKGMFDKEYSETIDGVVYTYISNIYCDEVKQISNDYGDIRLNKTIKYFYDERGNNTAIVESYDENYDPSHTQTICITYTYDASDNTIFICDQKTKYSMEYGTNNEMKSLRVGNNKLMIYDNIELINNVMLENDTSSIQLGGIIDKNENVSTYGNGQIVKKITTTYKVMADDTNSVASKTEVYYNDETEPTYIIYLNLEGKIKKLEDYSKDKDDPIEWKYDYSENGTVLTRSDGFAKNVYTSEDETKGTSTTVTSFDFLNGENESEKHINTVKSTTEIETNDEGIEKETKIIDQTLYNNDIVRIESNDNFSEEKIQSNKYDCQILKNTYKAETNTNTTFSIDTSNDKTRKYDYTYDLMGNITKIKIDDAIKYEYSYDAHGRLVSEKDYIKLKEYLYEYNTDGNVYGKLEYSINKDGARINDNEKSVLYEYENSNWSDQLTTYNGEKITYDASGNPIKYVGNMTFSWGRGRQLDSAMLPNGDIVKYEYNEYGLRTSKDTTETNTIYEWDGNTLLREIVMFKSTNQKIDIWYLYDANENEIGFEYSYTDLHGKKITESVYYEKNLQGDIIGLLDEKGVQIASYTYDAWGNITSKDFTEGNELPYKLNHMMYRGYYQDDETGFYYLQSRYYDAKVGRFINADEVMMIGINEKETYKDNLYVYCNGNPINCFDKTGKKTNKRKVKFNYKREKARKYMEKYWKVKSQKHGVWIFATTEYSGYNKRFPYLLKGDCTNYASQCMWYGDIPMTWCWYCYNTNYGYEFTHQWSVVLEHRKYVKKNLQRRSFIFSRNASAKTRKKYIKDYKIKVGDIIYFHSKKKKKYSHTVIVSKIVEANIYYSGHTKSRIDVSIMDAFKDDTYDYAEICCIKKKGAFYV